VLRGDHPVILDLKQKPVQIACEQIRIRSLSQRLMKLRIGIPETVSAPVKVNVMHRLRQIFGLLRSALEQPLADKNRRGPKVPDQINDILGLFFHENAPAARTIPANPSNNKFLGSAIILQL
jgi:hypothetical protein